jgi:hypothetical protein
MDVKIREGKGRGGKGRGNITKEACCYEWVEFSSYKRT